MDIKLPSCKIRFWIDLNFFFILLFQKQYNLKKIYFQVAFSSVSNLSFQKTDQMGPQGLEHTLALGVTLERAPRVSASNATQICNWTWRQTQQMQKSYLPKFIAENNTFRKFEIQQTLKQHPMPPPRPFFSTHVFIFLSEKYMGVAL